MRRGSWGCSALFDFVGDIGHLVRVLPLLSTGRESTYGGVCTDVVHSASANTLNDLLQIIESARGDEVTIIKNLGQSPGRDYKEPGGDALARPPPALALCTGLL